MSSLTERPRRTAFSDLCVGYCRVFGLTFDDIFLADARSANCRRRLGPGRPSNHSRYPSLIVSRTLAFLLLASQRRTELTIDTIAKVLGLDEWDTLQMTTEAESRLATDSDFALRFEAFLELMDERRKQACTYTNSMTYEQVGAALDPPISWQRVQQIEAKALAKLRAHGDVIALMKELRG
jgi:hypothetical protein